MQKNKEEEAPFRMSASRFMTVLALWKLLPWIAAAALLLALSILPAILVDVRWILLPLILLFLILPAVVAFLYIWYGTMPGYYRNVGLHTVTRTPDALIIRSMHRDEERCRVRSHRIPLTHLQEPQILAGGQLYLYKNRQGFVWIPINY